MIDVQGRIEQLEKLVEELRKKSSPRSSLAFGQYNPLVTREAGRIIMELPFDDSLDSSFPLECFFQMPTATRAIKSAKVWVQRKPFREYSSAAASGGGGTSGDGGSSTPTSSGSAHGHGIAQGNVLTDAQANHDHTDPQGGNTGVNGAHQHLVTVGSTTTNNDSPAHTHTVTIGNHSHSVGTHTHTLTPGIFESGPTGTLSLYVADDGVNYGSAIVTGASAITAQDMTGLTDKPGDKRIRLNATGLMRVQVLIVLDLRVSVIG